MGVEIKRKHVEELYVGDKITCAVTHEIKINRDSAWVRYEVTSTVLDDEGTTEAKRRVINHVASSVIEAVNATAEAVLGGTP